jgi:hypothetical protein
MAVQAHKRSQTPNCPLPSRGKRSAQDAEIRWRKNQRLTASSSNSTPVTTVNIGTRRSFSRSRGWDSQPVPPMLPTTTLSLPESANPAANRTPPKIQETAWMIAQRVRTFPVFRFHCLLKVSERRAIASRFWFHRLVLLSAPTFDVACRLLHLPVFLSSSVSHATKTCNS